ncbi:MAG: hypothetical protein ABEH77_02825 [Halobacteriaceae archaeon]
MVEWRPVLGLAMIVGGLLAFAAGGLYDVWWSWVLGLIAALVFVFGGMGVFFAGIMAE